MLKEEYLSPDEQTARGIFDRNIANSMHVNAGAFEEVLADIIDQLERPPLTGERYLTAWDMARRIAEAMSAGFAGLPPNGFDFACWLWEAAPLHVVQIPQANKIGINHGYKYGVIHLRKIAAMLGGAYIQQQPLKAPVMMELIDMSVDWVDARNLITYALLDHYDQYFEEEYQELSHLVDSPRPMRRLVPLGVCARILASRHDQSARAYELIRRACRHTEDENVYDALRYVLRVGGMYGDQHAMLDFLTSLRGSDSREVRLLICQFIRNPKLRWQDVSRQQVADLLRSWKDGPSASPGNGCLDDAIRRLATT